MSTISLVYQEGEEMKKSQSLMSGGSHGRSHYAQVDSPQVDSPVREEEGESVEHCVVRTMNDYLLRRPPPGEWRDGICSWSNNLWPSCFCSFFVCCGGWITGQIAQASGYQAFQSFVVPYVVAFTIFIFIFLVTKQVICLFLVWFVIFIYAVFLRMHFVKRHEITQYSPMQEFFFAIFCCPCSLAQMARHSFGYRLVFEGDSKASPPVYYEEDNDVERQVRELELTEHETQVLGRVSHEV